MLCTGMCTREGTSKVARLAIRPKEFKVQRVCVYVIVDHGVCQVVVFGQESQQVRRLRVC